ncbi:hypothetical protein MMC14_005929 [Varicellaria rhodocarpa]|nr:hypothetical protein [Varicellaria rhodocarpa]
MAHINARLFNRLLDHTCVHQRLSISRFNIRRSAHARVLPKYLNSVQAPYRQASSHSIGRSDSSNKIERQLVALIEDAVKTVSSEPLPDEDAILEALQTCKDLSNSVVQSVALPGKSKDNDANPASHLLFLDERGDSNTTKLQPNQLAPDQKAKLGEKISSAANAIIINPAVFITPKVLAVYLDIQRLLKKPESLGKVLDLYANKPIPKPGTNPVQFRPSNPNKASSAVPLSTANQALGIAIDARNLPLCLDIIKSTVCTAAYKRSKVLRRAMLPITGLALSPLAAYAVATQLSIYSNNMTPEMATVVAFAGILSYVGFTATLGIVAITTSNDQMDRVTWRMGTRLRDRWLKEDERAMLDRVAGAWGFKQASRRGEEEGPDWEALREWIGLRGMVLDKVSLMEGME